MNYEQLDSHSFALYIAVPGSKVVQLQAFFETYEGLGTVRTLDIRESLICILTTPSLYEDCCKALVALQSIIAWREVARPEHISKDRILGYFKEDRHA